MQQANLHPLAARRELSSVRYELAGNWKKGLAFDLHTVASTYLGPDEFGHDQFDNTRSEMGELVYALKYRNDKSAVPKIIEFLKSIRGIEKFDFIVPVPSSKARALQPVETIAEALGNDRGVPVLTGFLKKNIRGAELKNITDPNERAQALEGSITIQGDQEIRGKSVLLVDDLYRSGATLNACCSVLYGRAAAKSISVLTMTRTRTTR